MRLSSRAWARIALLTLALLGAAVLAEAVLGSLSLVAFLLATAVLSVVAIAASWWALMTRSAWKRVIYVGLLGAAAAAMGAVALGYGTARAGSVLVVALLVVGYAAAGRRALAGAVEPDPVLDDPPGVARPWLLVNPRSGNGTAGRVGLVDAAAGLGVRVHVLAPGEDPAALARDAVRDGADAIGVAGGDGSMALVAAVAMATGTPFVCIPAGTRNHFARDLGLDRDDAVGALRSFAGAERRIDAAVVGDRVFLNNVSLGAYADTVAQPEYRDHKLHTTRVMVRRHVRGERAPLDVVVRMPGGELLTGVRVLEVANNRYEVRHLGRFGVRERLDRGALHVSALRARTGASIALAAGQVAAGRPGGGTGWTQWEAPSLRVDSPLASVPAAVDGESVALVPPLDFRLLQGALRVLTPPPRRSARFGVPAVRVLWEAARA